MEVPEEPSREGGLDERAEASWLAWRVHAALEHLPAHERPVIEPPTGAGSRRARWPIGSGFPSGR